MRHERIDCFENGEYQYAPACGFRPNLRTYLHEGGDKRPCVLVIPGGGYRFVSPSEGEIVAKRFYGMGYQAFVGTYKVNLLDREPLKNRPLEDLSRMVRIIRGRAEEFRVDPGRVVICGFSAGAHLCGSLCVHWQEVPDRNPRWAGVSNRPDGAILSYPVITSGEFAHRDSFNALIGTEPSAEDLAWASLETQVTENTPPVFLWQTVTDEIVPVENSYLMAMALKAAGVPFAHHVFPKGKHGLSLANGDWANGRFGEPYTLEQPLCTEEAVKQGKAEASPAARERIEGFCALARISGDRQMGEPAPDAAVWPDLAAAWMSQGDALVTSRGEEHED